MDPTVATRNSASGQVDVSHATSPQKKEDESMPLHDCFRFDLMDYRIRKKLGCGTFSNVLRVTPHNDPLTAYALKMQRVIERVDVLCVARELLATCLVKHHPNWVTIHGWSYSSAEKCLYFLMEEMECDLFQCIRAHKHGIPLSECRSFTLDILDGISFLHELNIVHCDIKPANILVNRRQPSIAKLADLGLCRDGVSPPNTYIVTRWYRAPELFDVKAAFDTSIDIWSIGCTVWEMIHGKALFQGKDSATMKTLFHRAFHDGMIQLYTISICPVLSFVLKHSIQLQPSDRMSANFLSQYMTDEMVENEVNVDEETLHTFRHLDVSKASLLLGIDIASDSMENGVDLV